MDIDERYGTNRLRPTRLRVEYIENPIGIDTRVPRFSWEFAEAARGQMQSAYQIIVAADEASAAAGIGQQWDSGKITSSDTFHIEYAGKPLVSGQRYYWTVKCWNQEDEKGEAGSAAFFEMGILDQHEWKAQWISASEEIAAPLFRKAFHVDKTVRKATVYVSGLGYYEFYLNGRKIGDHVLVPNWTDYDNRRIEGLLYPFDDQTSKRVSYIQYSLTEALAQGDNALGLMLGNGFYNQAERTIEGKMSYGSPKLILQLMIEYEDGSVDCILSDESWTCSGGPIVFNNVFYGEIYDARLEQRGWADIGFNDSAWNNARLVCPPAGRLTSQLSPPDKVIDTIAPVSRTELKPGVYIFDFGQNISGWVRIRLTGSAGQRVILRFAEEIGENGELDMISTGGEDQVQTDVYILKGGGKEEYEPRFVWHGFRYAEVNGYPGIPEITDLDAVVVHAAVASAGGFECSEPLLNQVQAAYRWSQLTNLHGGVPSDCPHRERLGYTGDGHLTAEAAVYNFDMASFYTKWIGDISDSQNRQTGFVPHTAPFNGGGGGVAWGSAYVIMPWLMYRMYGDRRLLMEHYEGMKRWIAYLGTRNEGGYLVRFEEPDSWFLGDWCIPGESELPPVLVNNFYYAHISRIMAQVADVLGYTEDHRLFSNLFRNLCRSFNEEFFDRDKACYSIGRQGADVFPFVLGCVPDENIDQVWERVLQHYQEELDGHLDTGIFGTYFLFDLLSERGKTDTALGMVLKKDYPGYGYMIENGATTLWESWDGHDSHNHPMFGSVSAWFYKYLAGIAPHPESVAFGQAIFKPFGTSVLSHASASVHTIRGLYSIRWSRENADRWDVDVVIPPNCSADIYFPQAHKGSKFTLITDHDTGRCIWCVDNSELVNCNEFCFRQEGGNLILTIGSGSYSFQLE
ncbi:family 78 glycoside hydrolase catalytic domain [Paenibacillus nasutitermitis]|uniref:alpha-L-rhamnosidase n=1 Tax=Paenibacillus nasutitermitis TaxID=1652958 RepID=A0A916YVE5_9BACL|nr:family 78 glycoside hydrolase catalytic domain [Paenibacillus nasutitermitis]GGD62854.1 alpha-rhamnosidase [Paenibacillus nasutitermitis]